MGSAAAEWRRRRFAGADDGGRASRWRSLRGLASALTVLFSVNAVAGAFAVVAIAVRLGVIKDLENGNFTSDVLRRAQDSDDLVRAAAAIYAFVSLAIVVVFIIWMWRAAKNNEALGRMQPRLGPGWSIGGWFIPIANFVIPILIMQDLWRGSDPSVARGDPGSRASRGSGLIGWWWAAWLVGIVRIFVNSDNADSKNTLSDIKPRQPGRALRVRRPHRGGDPGDLRRAAPDRAPRGVSPGSAERVEHRESGRLSTGSDPLR